MYVIRLKRLLLAACLTVALTSAALLAARMFAGRQTLNPGGAARYTLIIDAGHGGMDGGASAADGTCEKNINLSIAQRLNLLCGLLGAPCRMTRSEDVSLDYDSAKTVRENKRADLAARLNTAQGASNPVFISIHLNKFEQPQYKGAQTFYSQNNPDGRILAELVQAEFTSSLDRSNTRVAKPGEPSIYLLKNLKCPAVIAECGFLSNPEDHAALQQPEYQKKAAYCIIKGYLKFLGA